MYAMIAKSTKIFANIACTKWRIGNHPDLIVDTGNGENTYSGFYFLSSTWCWRKKDFLHENPNELRLKEYPSQG